LSLQLYIELTMETIRVNERRKKEYCKSCDELIINKLKGSDYCDKCAKKREKEYNIKYGIEYRERQRSIKRKCQNH